MSFRFANGSLVVWGAVGGLAITVAANCADETQSEDRSDASSQVATDFSGQWRSSRMWFSLRQLPDGSVVGRYGRPNEAQIGRVAGRVEMGRLRMSFRSPGGNGEYEWELCDASSAVVRWRDINARPNTWRGEYQVNRHPARSTVGPKGRAPTAAVRGGVSDRDKISPPAATPGPPDIGARTGADINHAFVEQERRIAAERQERDLATGRRAQGEMERQQAFRMVAAGGHGKLYRRTLAGRTLDDMTRSERAALVGEDSDLLHTLPEWHKIFDQGTRAEEDTFAFSTRRMVAQSLPNLLMDHINNDLDTPLTPREKEALFATFRGILLTRNPRDDLDRGNLLRLLQELNVPQMEDALVDYLDWATNSSSKVRGHSLRNSDAQRQTHIEFAVTALARQWWPLEFYQSQIEQGADFTAREISYHLTPHLDPEHPLYEKTVRKAGEMSAKLK